MFQAKAPPAGELHDRAQALALSRRTLTLATSLNGSAWAAPVYYLFVSWRFYFFSDPQSRHIREALAAGQAGGSIHQDEKGWQAIEGLQMEGSLVPVSGMRATARLLEAYFKKFPGVKNYLDGIRKIAAEQGYVETMLGRKRYFPMLKNPTNVNLKNREEREAINAPIQGTAADIMKIAMLKLPGVLQKAGLSGKMLLQVHDEVVLECPKNELESTARVVQETE